jgi:hypothetical protein
MNRIVHATNVEGGRRSEGVTRAGNPRRRWKMLSLAVLYEWLALVIMMGVMRLPDVRMYWRKSHPALGARAPFRNIMSCRRFKAIRAAVRFSVPEEEPKVRARMCQMRKQACGHSFRLHALTAVCTFVCASGRFLQETSRSTDFGKFGSCWTTFCVGAGA